MLTVAVFFLLAAIFAAIFGFVIAGPLALVVFAVFFAGFLWALVEHLRARREQDR